MAEHKDQDKDLIFALDIGTRSIVGVVGKPMGDRFKVLDMEIAEHGKRTMLDGQIDDIHQVAALARTVTDRLEERLGVSLRRVCVAAAGRALCTQRGSFTIELPSEQSIDAEQISQLETGAVSAAEETLQANEESSRQFYLVGYTVAQYRLDNYPLSNLQHHTGKKLEVDVVATFLPEAVVESLYAAMRAAGLQVASMTLEPIAAMNAVIPAELRLLNLVLADIGAGTTDIAVCKDGSVVGYTMVTLAGDEITEAIMKALLVDFKTAEQIKRELREEGEIRFTNVLGVEETAPAEEVVLAIQEPTQRLAEAIAKEVLAINGGPPSALYLAGGGSRLIGLRTKVAECLGMEEKRVAIAGNNFSKSAFADELDLENPEYATPLGIAVSAGMGLLNDSYMILLNGEPAKLFRNGVLTLRDILLMNGYTYRDMMGRNGKSLSLTVDGKYLALRGEPAAPAVLSVNGVEASINTVIHAGDRIHFVPAKHGEDATCILSQLLGETFTGRALVNNVQVPLGTQLRSGDVVLTLDGPTPAMEEAAVQEAPVQPAPQPEQEFQNPAPTGKPLRVTLNGTPLTLEPRERGMPYYLMDLLEYSGLDFEHLDKPVCLEVNGEGCGFCHELKEHDTVTIRCI